MIGSKAQGNSVVGKDLLLLLLLLLSHFSRVQLCATPQTAAYQAPPSLGFSRQEHWSGLPWSSPNQSLALTIVPAKSKYIFAEGMNKQFTV